MLRPCIQKSVIQSGGTTSLFCYGYNRSGKTCTFIGSDAYGNGGDDGGGVGCVNNDDGGNGDSCEHRKEEVEPYYEELTNVTTFASFPKGCPPVLPNLAVSGASMVQRRIGIVVTDDDDDSFPGCCGGICDE